MSGHPALSSSHHGSRSSRSRSIRGVAPREVGGALGVGWEGSGGEEAAGGGGPRLELGGAGLLVDLKKHKRNKQEL